MKNLNDYKRRFNILMESEMGNVKPLINQGVEIDELIQIMSDEGATVTKDNPGKRQWTLPNSTVVVQLCYACGVSYIIDIRTSESDTGGWRFQPGSRTAFTKEKFLEKLNWTKSYNEKN